MGLGGLGPAAERAGAWGAERGAMTDTARRALLPAVPAKPRLSGLRAARVQARPCRQRDGLGKHLRKRPQARVAAADSGLMQSLFFWIAFGLGSLFFAACVVAWWEHLGRVGKRHEEPDWAAPPHKAASVDVELEALEANGDVGERRQALGGVMSRLAGPERRRSAGQGDTEPMILASTPSDAPPVERRQRSRVAAGE